MTEAPEKDGGAIAAEYVIGLLPGPEREAATLRIESDLEFSEQVAWWTTKLEALNADFSSVIPPARVKKRIDQRLFGERKRSWFPWLIMGLGLASFLLVFGIGLSNLFQQSELRAELTGDDAIFRVEVAADLTVTQIMGELSPDRVHELWLIPENGAPQSLGTFETTTTLRDLKVEAGTTLAVSLEPLGGSPTGAPTGPVVAVGVLEDA